MRTQDVKQRHRTVSPCACRRCGRFLGHYLIAFVQIDEGPPRLSVIDPVRRTNEGDGYVLVDEDGLHAGWLNHLPAEGRTRTTGVLVERSAGRDYIRVICRGCRRNESRPAEGYDVDARNAHDLGTAISNAGGRVPPQIADAAGGVVYFV